MITMPLADRNVRSIGHRPDNKMHFNKMFLQLDRRTLSKRSVGSAVDIAERIQYVNIGRAAATDVSSKVKCTGLLNPDFPPVRAARCDIARLVEIRSSLNVAA
jgi:hypothetical protein